ncbi:MAG TPA: helix-turn-helix transcriptional regulator [Dehalococcoidia bacterium]|nr:helix-turn-helix transcriptional regulator [Dehalococcoidia bacterium]
MRRKEGALVPLEVSILEAGIDLRLRGLPAFHGFLIAKEVKQRQDARLLTAHGTLYKALDRLQRSGFLESEWEDPLVAADEGRPRRRFYRVTAVGEAALARGGIITTQPVPQHRPGLATP